LDSMAAEDLHGRGDQRDSDRVAAAPVEDHKNRGRPLQAVRLESAVAASVGFQVFEARGHDRLCRTRHNL
jgi:hypothetical protein